MWIDSIMAKPLKKGYYKCLIAWDEYNTVKEVENQLFDGRDWSHFESARQFIRFWWAEEREYKQILSRLDSESEEYFKELEKHENNGQI